MKISEIKPGDTLVNTDRTGSGYYYVLKVARVKILVRGENGNEVWAYPHIFDRKVRASPPAVQWQPMETAPKDGSECLLFFRVHGSPLVTIGRWRAKYKVWSRRTNHLHEDHPPTHWMPLPEPPRR